MSRISQQAVLILAIVLMAACVIHQLARLNLDFLITTGTVTNPPDLNQLLDPSFQR